MKRALSTILRIIATVSAVICASLFVLTTLLSLVLATIEWRLFDPSVYKRALAQANAYERLPELLSIQLSAQVSLNPCEENPGDARCLAEGKDEEPGETQGGPPPMFASLTQADWEVILVNLAPPSWLQAQTESVIDQLFAYLNDGGQADLALVISMAEFKQQLSGPPGQEAILTIIRSMPSCTAAQEANLEAEVGSEPLTELPECRPSEAFLTGSSFTQNMERGLADTAQDIPTQVDLANSPLFQGEKQGQEAASPDESSPFGATPRDGFNLARWVMRLSPLLPVFLLAMIAALVVRSRKGLMRWLGIPMLIVGLMGLALAIAASPAFNWAYTTYVANEMPAWMIAEITEMGLDIVQRLIAALMLFMGGVSAVLIVLSTSMLLLSRRTGHEEQPEASPQPSLSST